MKAKVIWMQHRRGKVASRYGVRQKLVRFSRKRRKDAPCITVSGDWLKSAGFEIGDDIVLSVAHNRVIIEKVHDNCYHI